MKQLFIILIGLLAVGAGVYFLFFGNTDDTLPTPDIDVVDTTVPTTPTDIAVETPEPEPDLFPGDADRDGIPDSEERTLGLDATEYDTDRDGLADNLELNGLGTDPLNPDTDGDGLTDGQEFLIFDSNPNNVDSDGDGFDDFTEVENGYSPIGDGLL